jgi:hypothetical protein
MLSVELAALESDIRHGAAIARPVPTRGARSLTDEAAQAALDAIQARILASPSCPCGDLADGLDGRCSQCAGARERIARRELVTSR